MVKDFISLADFSGDELLELLDFADALKAKQKAGERHHLLAGKTIAMFFEKPSLRTRVTFQTGIFQLGGQSIFMETELGTREPVADVARNLDRWVDGIVARTFSHTHVQELAEQAQVPVINALTDFLHPCQIMADAQTLREHKGSDFKNLKLAFVGDGNNVFNSFANFASRVPLNVSLVCPPGFEADGTLMARVAQEAAGDVVVTNDIATGLKDADVVYTDVWASMGQESEAEARHKQFQPYQVNAALMAHAKPDAIFMHCLPAHRGEEVSAEVIDGPASVVFDQAENRLHAQKAVMARLLQ